jgi:hypothetical protein
MCFIAWLDEERYYGRRLSAAAIRPELCGELVRECDYGAESDVELSELLAEVRPRVRLQGHHTLCPLDPGTTIRHSASNFSHRLSRTSPKTATRRR